jgi:two-component system, LytTR family, sensor kinase
MADTPLPRVPRPLTPRRFWRAVLWLFALGTALGLLLSSQQLVDDIADGGSNRILGLLLKELTGAYAAVVMVPVMVWMARRYPFSGGRALAHLLPHALAVVGIGVAHTLLMVGSRALLFPAFGLDAPDSGGLLARFLKTLPVQLIAYTLTIAITGIVDRYRAARDRQVEAEKLRSRLSEAQLEALRSQLEPQFLLSTLRTISELVYSEPRAADEMIVRLSALLRHAFERRGDHETTLAEELKMLELYLELMRQRFAERLFIRVDVPAGLRRLKVPRLLLQPLVESAIRSGADPSCSLVSGQVSVRAEDGRLLIRVQDRGPCAAEGLASRGAAIANLAERIQALYGPGYGIELVDAGEEGSELRITLPVRGEIGDSGETARGGLLGA